MLFRKNSLLVVALAAAAVLVGTAGVAQATLVELWELNDAASSTSAVGAIGGNDLTPFTDGLGSLPAAGSPGLIGKAWQFFGTWNTTQPTGWASSTGSSCLRKIGSTNWPALPNVTQSVWVYIPADAPSQPGGNGVTPGLIRVKYTSGTGKDLLNLAYTDPNPSYSYPYPIQGRISSTSTTGTQINSAAAKYPAGAYIIPEQWNNLVYTYNGTTKVQNLYLNGAFVVSNTSNITGGPTADANAAIVLGGSGITALTNSPVGFLDDVGVWSDYLGAAQVGALYFTPTNTAFTTDAQAGFYGQKDMQSLFALYAPGAHTPISINGLTWEYVASGLPGTLNTASQVGTLGTGQRYILLDSSGGGVAQIPEPSTLALLAAGLVGLLCYAWRKRK